jgi:hypothetical protein
MPIAVTPLAYDASMKRCPDVEDPTQRPGDLNRLTELVKERARALQGSAA